MPIPKVTNAGRKIKPFPKASSASPKSPTPAPTNGGNGQPSESPSGTAAIRPEKKPDIVLPTRVIPFEDVPAQFRDIVDDLYQARRRAKAQEETSISERKNYDDLLDSLLIDMNVCKILMPDGWFIRLTKSASASRIDGKLLLSLGVSADVIKAATVPGNPYKYVTVDEAKSEKEKA